MCRPPELDVETLLSDVLRADGAQELPPVAGAGGLAKTAKGGAVLSSSVILPPGQTLGAAAGNGSGALKGHDMGVPAAKGTRGAVTGVTRSGRLSMESAVDTGNFHKAAV